VPWARFEDDYLGNTKLATLSTAAIALDMAAIIYSARELRDGVLRESDVQTIAALIHLKRWPPVATELVQVNRWARADGGFTIHDYLEYQPSRQQILAERAAAAGRMRRIRSPEVRPNFARSSEEVRKKFADPGPGPGPGPERSPNVPGTSPQPPPQAAGESAPTGPMSPSANGRTHATPPPEPACCPDFERTGGVEHWAYCENAPVEAAMHERLQSIPEAPV